MNLTLLPICSFCNPCFAIAVGSTSKPALPRKPVHNLLLLVLSLVFAGMTQAKGPSNVLLICVDDLKPTIGCYGDSIAITPHIDALAQRGVRFDAAYCNQAVCSPSRNSLMTGLRPQTIGIYDLPTHFRVGAPDAITFSQHFKNHGYHAQALGKIYHVGHGNIDDKTSWSTTSWRPKAPSYVQASNISKILPDAKGKQRGPATESADVADKIYADGKIANEAVKRLITASKDAQQPFFLAVGFMKPHLPFVAPQRYWDLYEPQSLPMPQVASAPQDAPSYAATRGGELRNYSDMRMKGPIDAPTTRHLIHGYYAATSYVDAQIGQLLNEVERLGLFDNTIVILWGDHGWHLGDHAMWCKHTNYQQAARIPLIIAAPGSAQGQTSYSLMETVDIYPTVVQLSGLPMPEGLDGISFAATLRDPQVTPRDHVTHVYPRGNRLGRAIRDLRYRMVEWKTIGKPAHSAEIELYDYETDPLETKNIAAKQPEIVAKLRKLLAQQPEARTQRKP